MVGYGDCKDYLYCFHGLADLFAFCLSVKPLGRTKKYVIVLPYSTFQYKTKVHTNTLYCLYF